MSTYDIICAGHICFDVIPVLHAPAAGTWFESLIPGKLIDIGDVTVSTGGPVSNTGIGLMKLGVKTGLMGKVGDDFFGQAVVERLKPYGADQSMTVVKGESTSYTIALAPPKVDRVFLHNRGANSTFGQEDVNYDLVAQTRLFHLGYPPLMKKLYADNGKQLTEIFKRAKATGATTSCDMALPDPNAEAGKADWDIILRNTLPFVDLYLPSVEETLYMLNRDKFWARKQEAAGKDALDFISVDDCEEVADKCIQYGAKIVILKSGHLGIYLRTADKSRFVDFGRCGPKNVDNWSNRQLWEPAFHVEKVASATGSGDSAIAGFLSAYVRGLDCEDVIRYACAVGGFNVQVFDAVSGIKSWDETTAAIKTWKKNEVPIQSAGWTFDAKNTRWIGPKDSKRG
ncbi:MAG: carbohydrate kinase family protein [Phycisphaerae bacterium]|nr:carbohydrate kinase family protein [Phycisphaerae bacterium]